MTRNITTGKPKISRTQRIVVTTIVRNAEEHNASGFLRVVDLQSGRVLNKTAVPDSAYRDSDPNPRGGTRGVRGVGACGNRLVVANSERLLIYDENWTLTGDISHRLTGGIHDILPQEEGIWVTCTSADLLIQLGWDGQLIKTWDWRNDENLRHALGYDHIDRVNQALDYRDPNTTRRGVANVVHMNAVTQTDDGLLISMGRILPPQKYKKRRFVSLFTTIPVRLGIRRPRWRAEERPLGAGPPSLITGSASAILHLDDTFSARVLCRTTNISIPNHNAIMRANEVIYNDSNHSRLLGRSLRESTERSVKIPGDPGFVRGLLHLGTDEYLVGSQNPCAIYRTDLAAEKIVRCYALDGAPNESVYAISHLPDSFSDTQQYSNR